MSNRLGEILVAEGLLAEEQLLQAERAASRLGVPFVAVLLEQGLVSEKPLVEALCRALKLEVFAPRTAEVDLDAVRQVPYEEATRYRLLPLQMVQHGNQLVLRVAMVNPLDRQAIEDIEFSTGSVVEPLIARPSELSDAIRHHYRAVVTKVIPRQRGPIFGRERGNGGANSGGAGRREATTAQRADALVSLLVRKGLISKDEYEEQLRTLIKQPEP